MNTRSGYECKCADGQTFDEENNFCVGKFIVFCKIPIKLDVHIVLFYIG